MKKKILIIDDEVDLVGLLKTKLELRNYHIVPLYTSKRSLEITKREKPDLILLDIMMPDKDGYEVCRELRADEDTSAIPIILFSAKPDQKEYLKTGTKSVGADDYIVKPFETDALLEKIKGLLG
ncbi:MAG: response regulator [Candidatus Omnitrophica bacterium]|nr:response regulator [Candidatus Omnitrophota bacterium]